MSDEKARSGSFIVFELAGTAYAVPSEVVQQVEMIDHVTPVPNAPAAVEGMVLSRGQVIPAINMRARFGFERAPIELRTRLIVVNYDGRLIGLIVDTAREFVSIPASAIQPPNEAISGLSGRYLEGIAMLAGRILLILKVGEVLNLSEIMAIEQPPAGVQPQAV